MLVALIILHIIMPIWAFSLGHLVFHGDVYTITGLVLAVVIPTGVTSMIWVSIYSGNTLLALTIIIIDTILSPFIVPFSISLFTGSSINIDIWSMMNGLITMIVIPSIIAMFLNQATKGKMANIWSPRLAPFQISSCHRCRIKQFKNCTICYGYQLQTNSYGMYRIHHCCFWLLTILVYWQTIKVEKR